MNLFQLLNTARGDHNSELFVKDELAAQRLQAVALVKIASILEDINAHLSVLAKDVESRRNARESFIP
jgi:hypothetical protein